MPDTHTDKSSIRHSSGELSLAIAASVAAGLGMLILGATGELWLDELWSLLNVSTIHNPLHILTQLHHDNNHLLNSLWIWICGNTASPFVYRLPSILFSLSSLIVVFTLGRFMKTNSAGALWLTLCAFSYPLVLYGSEARGYALAVLCALLSFGALCLLVYRPTATKAPWLFGGASCVGCLSHGVYTLFLASALTWLFWRLWKTPLKTRARFILWRAVFPPLFVLAILSLIFYRDLEIGGAPLSPHLQVMASTLSVAFGGEPLSSHRIAGGSWSLFAIGILLISVLEVRSWLTSHPAIASLVLLILVIPIGAIFILNPAFILPRYLIIQVVFTYLLAARFLARLGARGPIGSLTASLLLAAFIFSNSLNIFQLSSFGRSRFVEIFTSLANSTPGEKATVGGDQDYQNTLRLRYARLIAPVTAKIEYISAHDQAAESPHFLIKETLEPSESLPMRITVARGTSYTQVARFSAPPLNGSNVFVYERNDELQR